MNNILVNLSILFVTSVAAMSTSNLTSTNPAIHHAHLEEDSASSTHDASAAGTKLDCPPIEFALEFADLKCTLKIEVTPTRALARVSYMSHDVRLRICNLFCSGLIV